MPRTEPKDARPPPAIEPTTIEPTTTEPTTTEPLGEETALLLEDLYTRCDYPARVRRDPVCFVRAYSKKEDIEIAGLIAALLSYGRVSLIERSLRLIFAAMDARGGPRRFVDEFHMSREASWLESFRHRVTSGGELGRLFEALRRMLSGHETLEEAFSSHFRRAHPHIGPALGAFVSAIHDEMRSPAGRALRHLVPHPSRGSSCKRLNLFLRWMIRPAGPVDLGIWPSIPPSHLLLPLDTHTLRLSRMLELTDRERATWNATLEITSALRSIDPRDPVRFDFALCHFGMMGGRISALKEPMRAASPGNPAHGRGTKP